MQNIVTLGEINDALKIAAVTAAQLEDMGFAALANKPICEGLPPEESRRLRNAKLYPAESIGQIRVALAQRFAAPAVTTTPDERTDLVPGVMRCAKCEFQLVRQVLAVNMGEVFAGDSKTEPCPNDCGPLWPVTWKQYAEQAMDAAESMADRAFAAEKEVKQLRGELSALSTPNLRAKIMSTPLGLYGTGIGDIGTAYRAGHRAALLTAADLVASTVVAAPAAVEVPDDRAAFERELIDNHHYVPSDFSFKDGFYGGDDDYIQFGWDVWQARAALDATPTAVPVVLPEPDAVISELMGLVDEWGMESHLRGEAELDAQHSEATQEEIDCAKDRASKERAAWKAIESKLRALLAAGGEAQAAPAFYAALGSNGCALPQYSAGTEEGVILNVLSVARNEGYTGSGLDRLIELGWVVRPVYTRPTPATADSLATATGLPAQAVPAFCHVASLKLKSLQERGYQITGYALEKPVEGAQPERGFINHGGFVGWWWDGQSPQAQADARDAEQEVLMEHSGCGSNTQVDMLTVRLNPGDKVVMHKGRITQGFDRANRAAIAAAKGEQQ